MIQNQSAGAAYFNTFSQLLASVHNVVRNVSNVTAALNLYGTLGHKDHIQCVTQQLIYTLEYLMCL